MRVLGYSVEDWVTIIGFGAGIIFSLMKFYALFARMDQTLKELNKTVSNIEDRFSGHETRITRLEEQNKTLFKNCEVCRDERVDSNNRN